MAPTLERITEEGRRRPGSGARSPRRALSDWAGRLLDRFPHPRFSWPRAGASAEGEFAGKLATARTAGEVRQALADAARRLRPGARASFGDEPDRGPETLAVPLRFGGRCVGTLRLSDGRPGRWNVRLAERLAGLATLAAAAELALNAPSRSPGGPEPQPGGSSRDPATGLHASVFLDGYLPPALALAKRRREPLSLLIIAPEGIDRVRAHDGPEFGDAALRIVARAVTRTLRASDVVARLDGDRIAAALAGASRADLPRVCGLLSRAIGEAGIASAVPFDLVVRFAAATFPDDATNPADLLLAARPLEQADRERAPDSA